MSQIPYVDEPNPVTGMTSGKLATWLFLASEVMLFGALFSVYIVLRGAAAAWPRGPEALNVGLGGINTLVLLTSSLTMMMGISSLRKNDFGKFRFFQGATIGLALVFLAIKGIEYALKIQAGHTPGSSVFYAIYFTLTGFHALHIVAGIFVNAYLWGPGSRLWATRPRQFTGRVECAGLYWNFVDIVWICIYLTLYLL